LRNQYTRRTRRGYASLRVRFVRTALVFLALVLTACAPAPGNSGDGDIPENGSVSPFDHGNPAIGNLDPALRAALQQAAQDARERVGFRVTSGWRSKQYQQHLLDRAVARYGSLDEARKYVNTPGKSTHVSGKAVDIGPTSAADWLIQHGVRYGLCQVYSNEMWHFELLTGPWGGCPPLRNDAAG
jgi:D-alanyl-D-alanine carboxypeptidase